MTPSLKERAQNFWPWIRTMRDSGILKRVLFGALWAYWTSPAKKASDELEQARTVLHKPTPGFMWKKKNRVEEK